MSVIRPGMHVRDVRLGDKSLIGIVIRLGIGISSSVTVRWYRWADGSRKHPRDRLAPGGRYQRSDLAVVDG